jgi:hypothetical protein
MNTIIIAIKIFKHEINYERSTESLKRIVVEVVVGVVVHHKYSFDKGYFDFQEYSYS